MAAYFIIKQFKQIRSIEPDAIFFIVGIIIFVLTTLTRSFPIGFPKYQIPSLPLIFIGSMIVLSEWNWRKTTWFGAAAMTGFAFLVQYFFIGNLILNCRYAIKAALAGLLNESGSIVATQSVTNILFGSLAIILLLILLRLRLKSDVIPMIFFIFIGSSGAVTALQEKAGHNVGYIYGSTGTREVIDYTNNCIANGGQVIAPLDIVYYLNMPQKSFFLGEYWNSPEKISASLKDKLTTVIIFSPASNSIEQIRMIRETPEIRGLLKRNFTRDIMGSYIVYTRKGTYTSGTDNLYRE